MKTRLTLSLLLFLVISVIPESRSNAQTTSEDNQTNENRLSESQLKAIKSIRARAALRATPLGVRLALTAKRIYENLLSDREDAALRARLDAEIHRIGGQLLTIKGQAIRDAVHALTPEQKKLIKTEMGKPDSPADLMEVIERTFNIQ